MSLGPQIILVSVGLNVFSRHPGGAKKTQLKSYGSSKTYYSDSWGWVCGFWRIFNVSCDCLINLHCSIDGIFSSHVLRPEIL